MRLEGGARTPTGGTEQAEELPHLPPARFPLLPPTFLLLQPQQSPCSPNLILKSRSRAILSHKSTPCLMPVRLFYTDKSQRACWGVCPHLTYNNGPWPRLHNPDSGRPFCSALCLCSHRTHTQQHPKPQGAPLGTPPLGRRLCQVHRKSSFTPPSPGGEKPTCSQCNSRVRCGMWESLGREEPDAGTDTQVALPSQHHPPGLSSLLLQNTQSHLNVGISAEGNPQQTGKSTVTATTISSPGANTHPGPNCCPMVVSRQDRSLGKPVSCYRWPLTSDLLSPT